MLLRIMCSLLLVICSVAVIGQSLVFDAYRGDTYIGTLTVNRSEHNGEIRYNSVTDLTVTYIISMDLDFTYSASYRNGQLTSTSFKYLRNQKVRESCHGKASGGAFTTYFEDRKEQVNLDGVSLCLLASYWDEPVNRHSVFSERWGVNIPVVHLGNRKYKITLPDGKESHMIYSGGECREVTIVSGWGDIVFRR